MIQIYDKTTTSFSRNGRALHEPLSCYMDEELNGKHEVELDYPIDKAGKWKEIVDGNLIKADGQVYRIYNKKKSLDGIKVNARHLFYDNLDNFLEDVRPENLSGVLAARWILARTQYPNLFTVSGTLGGNATRYFIRKNVIEAFMGETGIINTWGGEIEHDNYNIILHARRGLDRGVHILYGKNILGIEETLNIDDVCTRMMPIGKDGLLLPEKYIDSPYIGNYEHPKIKTFEFSDAETEETLRAAAQDLMDNGEIDIPKANYKVDFIELSKTEEYKNYAVLERVYLGDVITIKHSKLGFDLKARVIKVRKNILTGRNETLELGYFLPNLASSFNDVGNVLINMAEIIKSNKTLTQQAIDEATHLLTTALGGYVVKRNGELLVMDTEDIMTALKLWRWNLNGFGYSKTGINGPYELAITMDGTVVAGTAFFDSIITNLIQSDIGSSLNLASNVAITGLVEDKAEKSEVTQLADSVALTFTNQKIGGRNLIPNSGFEEGWSGWLGNSGQETLSQGSGDTQWEGKNLLVMAPANVSTRGIYHDYGPLIVGQEYTFSAYVYTSDPLWMGIVANPITIQTTNGKWQRMSCTFIATAIYQAMHFILLNSSVVAGFYIDNVMLQEGNKPTEYAPKEGEFTTTSHTFTSTGYEMKDNNGNVLIEVAKGIANEQNFGSTQNVEDGYPLNMSFEIGDTTSVITSVKLRLKQYNFRTDSKGAASSGGVKTTPEGGGKTSGASSKSSTDERWTSQNLTGVTVSQENGVVGDTHNHAIGFNQFGHNHGMVHTHTTQDHSHSVDITHGHTVEFGILEYANGDGTIEVDIDGVRRTGTINTDVTLDITPWVTTNGVHTIALRSPNMKRIQCDVFIKSYIRR